MQPGVHELDERTFADTAQSAAVPLVVDFWAPWCGPCRATAPVFAALAVEFGDRAVFGSVNVDVSPGIAQQFGVRSIPTILVLRAGHVVTTVVGARSVEDLREIVASALRVGGDRPTA